MRFTELYSREERILSFEFFPPKTQEQLPKTFEMIGDLKSCRPHFVTVTYGAGGSSRRFTNQIAQYAHKTLGMNVAQHLTCLGHTAEEIDRAAEELLRDGIENIVALRGDPPQPPGSFDMSRSAFSCARDLTRYLMTKGHFSIAVAGYPETHHDAVSREADIAYLKEKVDAGAEAVVTQLFFDSSLYFRFVEDAQHAGIRVPIVPGIMPIANVAQIQRFTERCGASLPQHVLDRLERLAGDPAAVIAFGIDYAIDLIDKLLCGGAPGVHLYTLNRSVQARPIVEALHLGQPESRS